MDALFDAYGIAACALLGGTVLLVLIGVVMPKEERGKILHVVGHWFRGF